MLQVPSKTLGPASLSLGAATPTIRARKVTLRPQPQSLDCKEWKHLRSRLLIFKKTLSQTIDSHRIDLEMKVQVCIRNLKFWREALLKTLGKTFQKI